MSNPELFAIWAPPDRVWSQWAKPVLFAHCGAQAVQPAVPGERPSLLLPNDHATALVIDLPRGLAVDYGIAAAREGWWPVPLYNCAFGPRAALNVQSVMEKLVLGAPELSGLVVPREAPPAFLVDSKRMDPEGALSPGSFDNRYILLPQDFPSGGFLKAHGITRAVWLRKENGHAILKNKQPEDLAHILRRWQEAGIQIHGLDVESNRAEPLTIARPSMFRSLFYRGIALLGLRRNSAGGFGGIIPQPSSGG